MPSKTKTIIEENTDSVDAKSLALLGYRVQKLEEASKEAAIAQREGVEMLSTKIDTLAHNFVTISMLEASQREANLQHTIIKDDMRGIEANTHERFGSAEQRIKHLESINSKVAWIVISAVIVTVLATIGLKTGFVH